MFRFVMMLTLMVVSSRAEGQGIRMSSDFLPLQVGNFWRYEVIDSTGPSEEDFTMEIRQHAIVEGKSVYVFSQFPFAPGVEGGRPIGVRYDRELRSYKRFDGEFETELFPSVGATTKVVETDTNGFPLQALLDFATGRLVLERGVGIVEAEVDTPMGVRLVKLVGARVGSFEIGEMTTDVARTPEETLQDYRNNVTDVTEANPLVKVDAVPEGDSHHLILTIQNTSDKLLAFNFSTSQSFDFVIIDTSHGQEIWRWSRRMYFSRVGRSEAIRSRGEWVFEAVWNHRDDELNRVEAGVYEVFGILTAESQIESEPVEISIQ